MRCKAAFLVVALGMFLWGGLAVSADSSRAMSPRRALPADSAFDAEGSAPYKGGWECRYGDSPVDAEGTPMWALSREGDWHPCRPPGTPPGRGKNHFLWMHTLLNGSDFHDPSLFLLNVDQIFEAYLDGKLIYRFGELNDPARRHYAGHRPHYLPLGSGTKVKLLSLRIFSEHINIGLVGQVQIGSRLALTVATIRSGQDKLVVGALLIFIGLASLVLYATQRQEPLYGSYGSFTVSIGLYLAVYSRTRTLELAQPLLWNYVEVFALFVMAPCFLRFMIGLIGRGPYDLTAHLLKLHLGFVGAAVVAITTGLMPLMMTMVIFTSLLLLSFLYIVSVALLAAVRGALEERIFFFAQLALVTIAGYDSLAALGLVVRSTLLLSHLALVVFVIILAILPIRRLLQLQRTRQQALKLEVENAINARRMAEQSVLLDGAVRMANGDLQTPIAVIEDSPLRHLGQALDAMRRDLHDKFRQLEESHTQVRSLNEELLRQIEQRSRRLLEALLGSERIPVPVAAAMTTGSPLGEVYEVVRNLGHGAMGAVYEVERTTDRQRFAAKVLSADADKTSLIRFAREAQLLAKLSHPNLIRIVDVDVSLAGTLYIVMELVRGTTLRHLRPRYGDASWALPVLRQIAVALAAVHERGIIHRDQFTPSPKPASHFHELRLSSQWRWTKLPVVHGSGTQS